MDWNDILTGVNDTINNAVDLWSKVQGVQSSVDQTALAQKLTQAQIDIARAQAGAQVSVAQAQAQAQVLNAQAQVKQAAAAYAAPDLTTVIGNLQSQIASGASSNKVMLILTGLGVLFAYMQIRKRRG